MIAVIRGLRRHRGIAISMVNSAHKHLTASDPAQTTRRRLIKCKLKLKHKRKKSQGIGHYKKLGKENSIRV